MSRAETPPSQGYEGRLAARPRRRERWFWPLLLAVASVWFTGRGLHGHWLDLAWSVRDLPDTQWSPAATHARLWLDGAAPLLGALAAALCLQVVETGWRLVLAAALASLGVLGSDLLPWAGFWLPVPLLALLLALLSGALERPPRTSRLLLWGGAVALAGGVLWWRQRSPLDLSQVPVLFGSAPLTLLWSGLAVPALRDLSLLVCALCAVIVWLGRTPGTLRGGVVRALVFTGLSLGTALVFTLVVGGAAALLHTRNSFWPSVVAAALVAAGLEPARTLLARNVRQLLYGERDDPTAVMQSVARHLEGSGGSGPRASRDAIKAALHEAALALRLPSLWLELNGGERFGYGQPGPGEPPPGTAGSSEVGLLIAGGERLGTVWAAPRSAREPFTSAERELLGGVSRQLAGAVHAWQLAEDLQASQLRTVRAGEEERRRLRRDLHDGLGPALSGLGLKLHAASVVLTHSPQQAAETLNGLKLDVQESVAEVRRLVHDLRPPKLDDLGLLGALEELLRGAQQAGLETRLEVTGPTGTEPLPPLGAAVEVAAYRIAQEAVTNVLKHARATSVTLRLEQTGQQLTLECLDDGVGLPEVREAGVGSRSMRERAGALSGQLELSSAGTTGTRVCARLPLNAPPAFQVNTDVQDGHQLE